jgi:C4-dicarboxylate-specific signal transduction histidine kinase
VDYITKPIDLDETLARINTQLKVKNLFEQNIRLQQKLAEARQAAAIGAITEGIAHNLNNLMSVVVGYLDLLKLEKEMPENARRRVGLIDVAIDKMVKIVKTLTTISVNDSVPMVNQALHPLLSGALARFHADYKIDSPVSLRDSTDSVVIATNQEVLENIVGKLLINAWESYSEEASERPIEIVSERGTDNGREVVFIHVLDLGRGLDPTVADQIFDPFISSKPDVGRGLGLTLARHLIRCMGGDIIIKNRADGLTGVQATIVHPIAEAEKKEAASDISVAPTS